jgi:cyclopropane fatty-acyl-phospholipid synthase-like methyltransferase
MGKKRATLSALNADRHILYEASVQSVEFEADFLRKLYRKRRGHPFRVLREDFCGTAALACEWARRHPDNRAIGVDLHRPTLEWGRLHNLPRLKGAANRVTLLENNVLDVRRPKADVVVAFNYSYGVFKTRDILRRYFATVREGLNPDGILVLDSFGGTSATEEGEEPRKIKASTRHDGTRVPAFTYVWEQKHFNPVTSNIQCRIHFRFSDRSRLENAFQYDWRYWTLPEMQELMLEAGFREAEVHFEGWDDKKDEANGVFRRRKDMDEMAGWVCYVVGLK